MSGKIPGHIVKYLWDVAPASVSPRKHSKFIIERILEYGDLKSVKWMVKTYKTGEIVEILKTSKRISPKTGSLYALYFGVPKKELICIRKPFIQKQNRF